MYNGGNDGDDGYLYGAGERWNDTCLEGKENVLR